MLEMMSTYIILSNFGGRFMSSFEVVIRRGPPKPPYMKSETGSPRAKPIEITSNRQVDINELIWQKKAFISFRFFSLQ